MDIAKIQQRIDDEKYEDMDALERVRNKFNKSFVVNIMFFSRTS